jgi:hypothetical protein
VEVDYKGLDAQSINNGWFYEGMLLSKYFLPKFIGIGDIDALKYQGLYVTLKIDVSDNLDPKIVEIQPKAGRNNQIVVNPKRLANKNNDGCAEYHSTSYNGKAEKIRLADKMTVYNNALLDTANYEDDNSAVKVAANVTEEQEYRYVDTDGDGKYDTVFVVNEQYFVLSRVNTDWSGKIEISQIIHSSNTTSTYSGSLRIDPSFTGEIFRIRDKLGNYLQIDDLKYGQVMNIRVSDAGYAVFYDITVTEDAIVGIVVESYSEMNYLSNEMEWYCDLAANANDDYTKFKKAQLLPQLKRLNIGETVEAKIAANGKVIAYDRITKYWNCGVITANNVIGGVSPKYQLEILDSNGDTVAYNFARRINENRNDYDGVDFFDKYKAGSLVIYELNGFFNGLTEIRNIAVVGSADYSATDIDETMSGKAFAALYDYGAGSLHNYNYPSYLGETYSFTGRTVVFAYKFDGISDNDTDIKSNLVVGTEALIKPQLLDGMYINYESYNGFVIYNDRKEIEAVFLFNAWDNINLNSYPLVITKQSGVTIDGDERTKYQGYINGDDTCGDDSFTTTQGKSRN